MYIVAILIDAQLHHYHLQNKTSLTQVIKEAYYKTQDEYERFCLQAPVKNIDECYDLTERVVEGEQLDKIFWIYLL